MDSRVQTWICILNKYLKLFTESDLSPSVEEANCLEESLLLAVLLLRVRDVGPNTEAMRGAAVQRKREGLAGRAEEGLDLGAARGRHEVVVL